METIFDNVSFDSNTRPVFTDYELSSMVQEKLKDSGMSIEGFADSNGVSAEDLTYVVDVRGLFTADMYKLCSKILGISLEKILDDTHDSNEVAYRTADSNENVRKTFLLANALFNEIIMQKKIRAR